MPPARRLHPIRFPNTRAPAGWWDGTEARLVDCTRGERDTGDGGCEEMRTVPDLLEEAGVPRDFAVLSMDIEMRDVH